MIVRNQKVNLIQFGFFLWWLSTLPYESEKKTNKAAVSMELSPPGSLTGGEWEKQKL